MFIFPPSSACLGISRANVQGDELADDPLCPCFCKGPDSRVSLRAASAAGSTSAQLRTDLDYSLSLSTPHTTHPYPGGPICSTSNFRGRRAGMLAELGQMPARRGRAALQGLEVAAEARWHTGSAGALRWDAGGSCCPWSHRQSCGCVGRRAEISPRALTLPTKYSGK